MKQPDTKKATEVTLVALDSGERIKQSVSAKTQMCGLFSKSIPKSTPIHLVYRRSFRAVGESCVTNLIPDPKLCSVPPSQHSPELGIMTSTLPEGKVGGVYLK